MKLDHSKRDLTTRSSSLGHTHAVVAHAKGGYTLILSGNLPTMLLWSDHLRGKGRKAVTLPLADIEGLRA
jgi:hypothetical protein